MTTVSVEYSYCWYSTRSSLLEVEVVGLIIVIYDLMNEYDEMNRMII
jgi:hypothetical protein